MKNFMTDEEFSKANSIIPKEINKIYEDLEQNNIVDIENRINYVYENYEGHLYINFLWKELDDMILRNYHNMREEFTFTKSAVDGLLRAFYFATEYMQPRLPEHVYNYIKNKSSLFSEQLVNQYK